MSYRGVSNKRVDTRKGLVNHASISHQTPTRLRDDQPASHIVFIVKTKLCLKKYIKMYKENETSV